MRQKAPSAKRCIKTEDARCFILRKQVQVRKHRAPKGALRRRPYDAGRALVHIVRKHRAPKGALRLRRESHLREASARQKAPSAKRCIKTVRSFRSSGGRFPRQKAPSAKRCIKTLAPMIGTAFHLYLVRKHRAPKGALRQFLGCHPYSFLTYVRKHRAPKGALRHASFLRI